MTSKITTLYSPKPGDPPRPLGPDGQALWDRINADFLIDDAGGIELLALACAATDRASSCAATIEADGLTVPAGKDGGIRQHPLLPAEAAARAQVASCLKLLGVNVEPIRDVGRPGGTASGWRGGR